MQINSSEIDDDSDGYFISSLSTEMFYKGYSLSPQKSELSLYVRLEREDTEQIGFRFDVDSSNQSLTTRLVPNEEEKKVHAKVWISRNGCVVLGPKEFQGVSRYDFIDSNALTDVQYNSDNTLEFSFGQLDAVQGARGIATHTAYSDLAVEIANWLSENSHDLEAPSQSPDEKD